MDLLEFMMELDSWYYMEVKNMIPFTTELDTYQFNKWYYIYNFSQLSIQFFISRKNSNFS